MNVQAKELKKELAEMERPIKRENRDRIRAERESNSHITYGLGHNSLLLRINPQTINKWINMKYVLFAYTRLYRILFNDRFTCSIFIECTRQGCMDNRLFWIALMRTI